MIIALSYFYQIRFFKPYMIPVSTALYDPTWYHKGWYDQNVKFLDKNGVINGIRIPDLQPHLESNKAYCSSCTEESKSNNKSHNCEFLTDYRSQLDELNFHQLLSTLTNLGMEVKYQLKFTQDPIIVLMVYESPKTPCSERWVLFDYFKDNNYPLYELQYPIKLHY